MSKRINAETGLDPKQRKSNSINPHFEIKRYPALATMKRGPNMKKLCCMKCLKDKTHGYSMIEFTNPLQDRHTSWFVCDDCFNLARRG